MDIYDLIIIGAGPAGLTAGLYAGRFRLRALILEKLSLGGQIMLSPAIENFPGFPGGIATSDLINKMKEQVEEVGVEIRFAEVISLTETIQNNQRIFALQTPEGVYKSKCVIVAVGAQPKKLAVTGEDKFVGRGVSYCGTCDGPLFRDKDILVVGGGDRAIEEAIFLSSYARKVTVVHRRDQLRASGILEEKARGISKIGFLWETVVEEIRGKDSVEEVVLRNTKDNASKIVPCKGVFIFVGILPNTDFAKKLLQIDRSGFIMTRQNQATSIEGVFACGDCIKKDLYQVVNATAEGAVAADTAHRYLLQT